MRQLLGQVLGIALLAISSSTVVYSQSLKHSGNNSLRAAGIVEHVSQQERQKHGPPIEEFSFVIKDFKLDHQTEAHTLNISISYRYVANIANSDYPDFRWLAKDVETFLTNYPNENDYWEIVNKQLTSLLLRKYPAVTSLTCEMKVEPSRLVPYTRSSRVTLQRTVIRSNRKRA